MILNVFFSYSAVLVDSVFLVALYLDGCQHSLVALTLHRVNWPSPDLFHNYLQRNAYRTITAAALLSFMLTAGFKNFFLPRQEWFRPSTEAWALLQYFIPHFFHSNQWFTAAAVFMTMLCVWLLCWNRLPRIVPLLILATLSCLMLSCPVSYGSLYALYAFHLLILLLWQDHSGLSSDACRPIQAGLVTVYFLSGWRKAVWGDWISDWDTLLNILSGPFQSACAGWLIQMVPAFVWTFLQFSTVFFQLAAPLIFFHPRMVPYAVVSGLAFHLGISLLLQDLWIFSLAMLPFYVPFFAGSTRFAGIQAR